MEMLRGRGSVAYYPDNIIRLIEWIREWQAEGETLKQIKERLSQVQDVTPKEEILIPVDSNKQGDFAKAYAKVVDDIHHRLDPENPPPKDFWVRFQSIEKDGKKFYRVVSALSRLRE
jgi:DNA-binding transcriptional MerR regulator